MSPMASGGGGANEVTLEGDKVGVRQLKVGWIPGVGTTSINCPLLMMWLAKGAEFKVQGASERGYQAGGQGQKSHSLKCHPEGLGPCLGVPGSHGRGRVSSGCGKML